MLFWFFVLLVGFPAASAQAATQYCIGQTCGASAAGVCSAYVAANYEPHYSGVVEGTSCRLYQNGSYFFFQWAIVEEEIPDPEPDDPTCPPGTRGIENYTTGWGRSSTPNANDHVVTLPTPPVDFCKRGCTRRMAGIKDCYRSQQPGPTGLFRISCDYEYVSLGQYCTTPIPSNNDPEEAPPPCPGFLGEVNGKPVCVGSPGNPVPTTSPNPITPDAPGTPASGPIPALPPIEPITPGAGGGGGGGGAVAPTEDAGNPAAGTKPETGAGAGDGGAGRTPATGDGGNAGGGSSASIPGGGSTGTDGGPDELTVEVCGLPGKPACKIDETGTPAGITGAMQSDVNAWGASDAALRESLGVGGNAVKPPPIDWTLGLTVPAQACTVFQMWKPGGGTWAIDLCGDSRVATVRALLAWFFYAVTAIYCYRVIMGSIGRSS